MYPWWCIGAMATLYLAFKVYTSRDGKTTIKDLGDNLHKSGANAVVADSSNNYDVLENRYKQSGVEDGLPYEQFGGSTPNGGMVSWIIQAFKTEKK